MANRARQQVIPEGRFERAAWIEEQLPTLLQGIPLEYARLGWAGVTALERQLFSTVASDWLGGHLDPACPACGVETEEGTIERAGELWRVTYRGCGDVFDLTEQQLRERVRPHAGHA